MQDQEKHFYNDQQHDSSEFNRQEINRQCTAQTTEANRQPEISNKELSNLILTLNTLQPKIFIEVQDWTRKRIKTLNCTKNVSIDPLRLFITGGAGFGKSHLMKTICMFFLFRTTRQAQGPYFCSHWSDSH